MKSTTLLSAEDFVKAVFSRDKDKCVFCDEKAVEAHYILNSSLFKSGGNYIDNGVSVCDKHNWECKNGYKTPEKIREKLGIYKAILPKGYDGGKIYNRWGENVDSIKGVSRQSIFLD
jgi:hypothetical protein